ncbi:MAG: hypothetical protein HY341_00045, partial [Candidatus Kerfeldbacteria bacterium]|nr:hypothetical protein [Candidatus Kerfeldbacteria bacterium]
MSDTNPKPKRTFRSPLRLNERGFLILVAAMLASALVLNVVRWFRGDDTTLTNAVNTPRTNVSSAAPVNAAASIATAAEAIAAAERYGLPSGIQLPTAERRVSDGATVWEVRQYSTAA